ncbi:unnamed protein product, partial [Mesorhabditis belari]|uniref:Uncharacterized protein n=1 Tax=Mesorhabditis belari TaxID=2138241 RepID=A0AAF3EIL0_9BILA
MLRSFWTCSIFCFWSVVASYDPCTPKSSRTIIFLFDPTVPANDQEILAANDSLDPLRNAIIQTANLYDVAGKKAYMGLGEMRTEKYLSFVDPSQISSILDSWKETTSPWKIGIDDMVEELKNFGYSIMVVGFETDVSQLSLWGNTTTVKTAEEFVKLAIKFNEGYDCPGTTTIAQTISTTVERRETTTDFISTTPKYQFCTQNSRLDI